MVVFPGVHAELIDTQWISNAEGLNRPSNGIHITSDGETVVRVAKLKNFEPFYEGRELSVDDALCLHSVADEQFERLRGFGVHVVNYSRILTADTEGERYGLTFTEKVESVHRHSTNNTEKDNLINGLASYIRDGYENTTPLLRDIFKNRQYIYGHTVADPDDKLWLVDLDPLVADPHNLTPDLKQLLANFKTAKEGHDYMYDDFMRELLHMVAPTQSIAEFYREVGPKIASLQAARKTVIDYFYRRIPHAYPSRRKVLETELGAILNKNRS